MTTDSDRATVEFDAHAPDYVARRHDIWATARQTPVAHSDSHGGFWVVSGHAEVSEVAKNATTYSCYYGDQPESDGMAWAGILGVPRAPGVPRLGLGEREGPDFVAIRRALNPYFLPAAVTEYAPVIQQAATYFLDQRIADGRIDIVNDYAGPVAALITMVSVGLPFEEWTGFHEIFHNTMAYPATHPKFQAAQARLPELRETLGAVIDQRRATPGSDLISTLIAVDLEGHALTNDEILDILWNVIGGGLDTTSSLVSLVLMYLYEHPDQRDRLINEPELMESAREEFVRYYAVSEFLGRTVTTDVELGGQRLHRGDPLLVGWRSANHDERVFECPDEIRLDRTPNPHVGFGVGPHRCIGMHLARVEFDIVLREFLTRVPDYVVDIDGTKLYERELLAGATTMPATFAPGVPVGVERPF